MLPDSPRSLRPLALCFVRKSVKIYPRSAPAMRLKNSRARANDDGSNLCGIKYGSRTILYNVDSEGLPILSQI